MWGTNNCMFYICWVEWQTTTDTSCNISEIQRPCFSFYMLNFYLANSYVVFSSFPAMNAMQSDIIDSKSILSWLTNVFNVLLVKNFRFFILCWHITIISSILFLILWFLQFAKFLLFLPNFVCLLLMYLFGYTMEKSQCWQSYLQSFV